MIKVNKKIISAGVGVIAGAIGGKVLTSKLAKKAAVATVQQGLKAKSAVDKTVENIKVTTDDIVAEAKVKNEIEEKLEAEAKANLDIENVAKKEAEEKIKEEIKEDLKEKAKED